MMPRDISNMEYYIRRYKLQLLFISDVVLMMVSMSLAVLFLSGNQLNDVYLFFDRFWWIFPLLIAFRIGVFRNFGLYHWAWQYMSVREVLSLIKSILFSSVLVTVSIIALGKKDFPFSSLAIEAILCFTLLGGVRLLIRMWKEKLSEPLGDVVKKTTLIVGAGDAGEMILREMLKLSQLKYKPIGFVDDNASKKGVFIHHLPVLGKCEDIPDIVAENAVEEIIIALPSANHKQIRRIVDLCEMSGAKYKIVPGIFELIDGTVHVSQIRNVEIEDLLGREPIKQDLKSISSYISDSKILITGAGGSIGSELCRQVAMYNPSQMIILGKGENSIFDIELELRNKYPYLDLVSYIADIRDVDRINNIFKETSPDVVFHAAAHKHVSLMEKNADEAILNNVMGTKNIVDSSDRYGVKKFVMISTDKAVNPSNIMGATKRVAEMIVQSKAASGSKTKFVSVRFGNVLGSRGSVVPLFKKQIAARIPVTVTHPEAKRYFMTIPEAVQLVIQAGAMGAGGEIFILDMGEPVKIVDLAKDLIKLSGLELGIDIDIKFIGLKPGEKMFEELLTEKEGKNATKNEKIFVAPAGRIDQEQLLANISKLSELACQGKKEDIKLQLKAMIPTYEEVIL